VMRSLNCKVFVATGFHRVTAEQIYGNFIGERWM
jgi:hypothetical protein